MKMEEIAEKERIKRQIEEDKAERLVWDFYTVFDFLFTRINCQFP